jgi:hypothetical protein
MAAVRREADLALAGVGADPRLVRLTDPAPWDLDQAAPFPALRRLMVKTPAMAAELPAGLGARPGTRYVLAEHRSYGAPAEPSVALDPGGDLAGWAQLGWVAKRSGQMRRLSSDPADYDAHHPETLDAKAAAWSERPRSRPVGEVVVTPEAVRYVGRASGVLDAAEDGAPGELDRYRPVYADAERLSMVHDRAAELGPRAFARLTGLPLKVAERAALGRAIAARNVARALRALRIDDGTRPCACGCGEPVLRGRTAYVDGHRERAKKRRQRRVAEGRLEANAFERRAQQAEPTPFRSTSATGTSRER